MRDVLNIEEETASMSLTLLQVLPRDFVATEEIFQAFANFFHAYSAFLNRNDDISPDAESAFQDEYKEVIDFLLDHTNNIRALRDM